eukprot:CAMPEP_0116022026 /NCGR_PEP_ID=MMETSP0321-20121206/10742_1 /TAXON_ID=163516 /ORGANISM="Leptocylindrus danicus var. danicus, Strain B650" /LENGTH=305 /DNA_ID=CAMNT_0003493019 /DNA_START=527 /DNA_END=1444 /DNA_ORIENTATION=+
MSTSSSTTTTLVHDNAFLTNNVHNTNADDNDSSSSRIALIILNTPGLSSDLIRVSSKSTSPNTDDHAASSASTATEDCSIFQRLWNLSSYRVCADGGANRLLDAVTAAATTNPELFIPDLIRGDLDSLRSDVRQYYSSNGCSVEQDFDQDTNDLDKCLQALAMKYTNEQSESSSSPLTVCVFGAFGGRFDQEMASINALYRWKGKFHRLILYTEETSALLLPEGVENRIRINKELEGPTCGLIPIGFRCESCTTTGLKWNLSNDILEFGGMVSSSNHVENEVVTVHASSPLIWTTEMKRFGDGVP